MVTLETLLASVWAVIIAVGAVRTIRTIVLLLAAHRTPAWLRRRLGLREGR